MNYGLLLLSSLLWGIGLILEFAYGEPIGLLSDGFGLLLILYVLYTSRNSEKRKTLEEEALTDETRRLKMFGWDRKGTWTCPACQALNSNVEKACYRCRKLRYNPEAKQEQKTT